MELYRAKCSDGSCVSQAGVIIEDEMSSMEVIQGQLLLKDSYPR